MKNEFVMRHEKVALTPLDVPMRVQLECVQRYLESGKVTSKDAITLGVDPMIYPNCEELYVRRLAFIIERLLDTL